MLLSSPPPLSSRGKVLIDGDVVAYRAAFSPKSVSELDAAIKVDQVIDWIVKNTCYSSEIDDFEVYLTGSGNFRHEIAVSYPYKGNRTDREKPKFLEYSRWYLKDNYGAVVSSGQEADDSIAIEATRVGPSCIVASIDKDMLQIPCFHFNFKRNEWHEVDEFDGLRFFYGQMLTGDTADNIIGLNGIGPVKAEKILKDCETEEDLWDAVLSQYDGNTERLVENARLLWLRRQEEELWVPPAEREQSLKDTDQD